jgi:hypothetical protein
MRHADVIKREPNLLDDGVVDTLGSVGATSGVHISVSVSASGSARIHSRSSVRWRGNIGELQNVIERAVILSKLLRSRRRPDTKV